MRLRLLRKKELPPPATYPADHETLAVGVYNRWKSSFLGKQANGEDWYSAMGHTIEYFVVSAVNERQVHVVRIMKETGGNPQYIANYVEDSRVFDRPIVQLTASDVMNAYPVSTHERQYSGPEDHFGLRRVGTLDEFVERIKSGRE